MTRSLSKRTQGTLALIALICLTLVQCNRQNCEDLRNELSQQKAEWAKCTRSEECIIVGGSESDCTGILACNFAVHRQHRLTAERVVASLPEDSVDCLVCGIPNCERGTVPYCEPISGRCMVVTDVIDGVENKDLGILVQSPSSDEDTGTTAGEGGASSGANQQGSAGQAGAAP